MYINQLSTSFNPQTLSADVSKTIHLSNRSTFIGMLKRNCSSIEMSECSNLSTTSGWYMYVYQPIDRPSRPSTRLNCWTFDMIAPSASLLTRFEMAEQPTTGSRSRLTQNNAYFTELRHLVTNLRIQLIIIINNNDKEYNIRYHNTHSQERHKGGRDEGRRNNFRQNIFLALLTKKMELARRQTRLNKFGSHDN